MRESWRLRQINERIDAQWCLLQQRVWSCDVVSKDAHTEAVYRPILTVFVHLEVYSRLRVLIQAAAMSPACLR